MYPRRSEGKLTRERLPSVTYCNFYRWRRGRLLLLRLACNCYSRTFAAYTRGRPYPPRLAPQDRRAARRGRKFAVKWRKTVLLLLLHGASAEKPVNMTISWDRLSAENSQLPAQLGRKWARVWTATSKWEPQTKHQQVEKVEEEE